MDVSWLQLEVNDSNWLHGWRKQLTLLERVASNDSGNSNRMTSTGLLLWSRLTCKRAERMLGSRIHGSVAYECAYAPTLQQTRIQR